MKKYTVVVPYNDKHTGEARLKGMEVELTDARAKELKSGGYVEEAEKTPKTK